MSTSAKQCKTSRYEHVFKSTWSDWHGFLKASRKGQKFAFCELCRANFSIGHGGYKDCRKHVQTAKHASAAHSTVSVGNDAHASRSPVSAHAGQDTERSGGAPGDATFKIPDVPCIAAREDKDPLPFDCIVKVKVEAEFMEYSVVQNEDNPFETKRFQSNAPQTSQETLGKVFVKQEPSDALPKELRSDSQPIRSDPFETKCFQSNAPQTFQETLGKVFVKQEPSDALPKELSSDSQLIRSNPFETLPFQSNVPHTSQETLGNVSVKQDPSDAPSMGPSSDSLPIQTPPPSPSPRPTAGSIQSKRSSLEAPSGSQPCKKQTSLEKFLKPQQARPSTQCKDPTSCVATEPQTEDDATPSGTVTTDTQDEVHTEKIPIEFLSAAIHQPTHKNFPHRKFGKQKRAFQSSWFKRFPWLHYSECTDHVLCYLCMKSPLVGCSKKDERFIKKGFCNWKKGLERFNEHQKSARHRIAVQEAFLPSQCGDIGENLSQVHQTDKRENRKIFLEILRNTRYLARQGLPLRGDDNDDEDGNLFQLIKLRGQTDDHVQGWLKKGSIKYLSKGIQNEQLQIMGLSLLRNIAANVHKSVWYTIMGDEVADTSRKQQLAICIRWINDMLEVEESFTGLYQVENMNADMPVAAVRDTLFKLNLSPSNARGQCYDGITHLRVPKSVICTRMQREAPRATFTHCYGHTVQLAVCFAMREVDEFGDVVDTVQEITELRTLPHKRNTILDQLRHEIAPDTSDFHDLCPTRCTVSADSFQMVIDNYGVLRCTWDEYLEDKHLKSDVKAQIVGIKVKMESFDFYFGTRVAGLILKLTDNLSKTLEHTDMSASNCQEIAVGTLKTLEKMRSDYDWQLFWASTVQEAENLCLTDLTSPQKRRIRTQSEYPETTKEHYHRMWNRAFDSAKEGIEDRFDQPGYVVLKNLECILAKGANGEPYGVELSTIEEAYKGDFSPKLLAVQLCYIQAQLNELGEHSQTFSWRDVLLLVRKMTLAQRNIVSEVVKILKLLLLIPATSAVGLRSASVLHRVKTYLASTVAQQRLNHCVLLHVHKELTDSINLIDAANEFVNNEKRQRNFGRFSEKDVE
uniref:zinc finger MYM-type protein 1-like isoform X2 n=1 Tax=Myxine glutinosa TaxID=7769 RepID=UPI00358EF41D